MYNALPLHRRQARRSRQESITNVTPPPPLYYHAILCTVHCLSIATKREGQASSNTAPTVPMVAVLTTRRVLILSAERLTPVAEAWGHPLNSRAVLGASGGLSVSPVAMAWAGASVVCTLEDGR